MALSDANHRQSLTSIRGLASLVVLAGHVTILLPYEVWGSISSRKMMHAASLSLNGSGAVLLFFVLSGCVLSLSLVKRKIDQFTWPITFYLKRAFRIFPLLWVAVALGTGVTVAIQPLLQPPLLSAHMYQAMATGVDMRRLLLSLVGLYTRYDSPMWSLRVELIYSLLFPVIYWSLENRRFRLLSLLIYTSLALLPFPADLGFQYAISFALGALIPMLPSWQIPRKTLIFLLALIGLTYFRGLSREFGIPIRLCEIEETFCSFFIIYTLYFRLVTLKFLENAPLLWLGEISYGIYLLHYPLLLTSTFIVHRELGISITSHPTEALTLIGILDLFLTIALASIVYLTLELPLQNRGRKIANASWVVSPLILPGVRKP